MSVFKKVIGFFFEEDEEITEEGELTSIELREEPKVERPPVITRVEPPIHHVESVETTVKKEEAILPIQEEKHFVNIEIDDVPKKTVSTPLRKSVRAESTKSEFEFTPVISPIFGADEKTVKKAKTSTVPKNRQTIPASPKKSAFDMVISPIYGASEPEEKIAVKEEITSIMEEDEDIVMASYPDISEDDVLEVDEEDHGDESIPLEDLLTKEELSDTDEDLLQFSLFGDDEIVKSEKITDSYTIKE